VFITLRDNNKLVLFVISLASFMAFLDISIVNVSIPLMDTYFNVSTNTVLWVSLIYIVVLSSFLIAFGKIAEQRGYKKIFLVGFIIFTIGSFLCGITTNFAMLIVSRFIQAVGAAMFSSITSAMIVTYFSKNRRGFYMGITATMASLGYALGPIIGGYITYYLNFHYIFFINVPIGIMGVVLGYIAINETNKVPGKSDLPGMILIFIAQGTLIFSFTSGLDYGWFSWEVLGSLVTSIISWILFFYNESVAPEPLLDLNFVRIKQIALASTSNFFFTFSSSAAMVILPYYLELAKRFSISQTGLFLAVIPFSIIILGPITGALSDRVDSNHVSMLGAGLGIVSCVLLASFNPSTSSGYIIITLVILGASVATFNPPNTKFIVGESPVKYRGIASGFIKTARMMGNGVGIAVLGTVAELAIYGAIGPNDVVEVTPALMSIGIQSAFVVGTILMVLALVLIALTKREHKQNTPQTNSEEVVF
jgi:DHA2 family metal-tetracycline-proton antiporter-like MFS transporter